MSYALESKKRKFDRLLESLTEISSQPLKPSNHTSTTTRIRPTTVKEVVEASKRRRVTPTLRTSISNGSLVGHYLPSSRAAFLERLETYRHITKWHVPSTIPINAAEWAKRGWVCSDVDTVSCGSCSEKVIVDLSIATPPLSSDKENTSDEHETDAEKVLQDENEDDVAVEFYEALVKRYQSMITTSHSGDCPWRKRGCDSSIQKIEGLLNTSSVIETTRARTEVIVSKIEDVPLVLDLPTLDEVLIPKNDDLQVDDLANLDVSATKLAICGWNFREADVVECKNCFRSLGLWLYRGETPTIEHLDAVESHLEYCPWRSPVSQNTEIVTSRQGSKEVKVKFSGWALVYSAIQNHKQRQRGGTKTKSVATSDNGKGGLDREEPTPEQREKRVKDLIQRIKEIKKPFNVKSLVRKKKLPDR